MTYQKCIECASIAQRIVGQCTSLMSRMVWQSVGVHSTSVRQLKNYNYSPIQRPSGAKIHSRSWYGFSLLSLLFTQKLKYLDSRPVSLRRSFEEGLENNIQNFDLPVSLVVFRVIYS